MVSPTAHHAGTLASRFDGTVAAGELRGKTGTLGEILRRLSLPSSCQSGKLCHAAAACHAATAAAAAAVAVATAAVAAATAIYFPLFHDVR